MTRTSKDGPAKAVGSGGGLAAFASIVLGTYLFLHGKNSRRVEFQRSRLACRESALRCFEPLHVRTRRNPVEVSPEPGSDRDSRANDSLFTSPGDVGARKGECFAGAFEPRSPQGARTENLGSPTGTISSVTSATRCMFARLRVGCGTPSPTRAALCERASTAAPRSGIRVQVF